MVRLQANLTALLPWIPLERSTQSHRSSDRAITPGIRSLHTQVSLRAARVTRPDADAVVYVDRILSCSRSSVSTAESKHASERQLQSKLYLARCGYRAADTAPVRRHNGSSSRCHSCECGSTRRHGKIGMVHEIEKFSTELQAQRLAQTPDLV